MNRCVIDRRIKLVFQFTSVPYIHRYMFESRLYRGVLDKTLCDLRQADGFLWVLRFPPPIKLTATI